MYQTSNAAGVFVAKNATETRFFGCVARYRARYGDNIREIERQSSDQRPALISAV